MPTCTGSLPPAISSTRDSPLADAAARAAEGGTVPLDGEGTSPRVVIRGETPLASASAFIDWLSITVPGEMIGDALEWAKSLPRALGVRDLVIGMPEHGTAGYLYSAPLVIFRAGKIEVPTFADSSLVLSPPLYGLPLEGDVVIPFQPKDRPRLDIPFRIGDQSFVPEAPARLTPGSIRDICVFVWPARQGATPAFDVAAEIIGPGNTSRALTFDSAPVVVKDGDGFDRYVVPVIGPEASSGNYTLRLTFRDPSTGQRTTTETTVWLEN